MKNLEVKLGSLGPRRDEERKRESMDVLEDPVNLR